VEEEMATNWKVVGDVVEQYFGEGALGNTPTTVSEIGHALSQLEAAGNELAACTPNEALYDPTNVVPEHVWTKIRPASRRSLLLATICVAGGMFRLQLEHLSAGERFAAILALQDRLGKP
jgi:hypothetical protein